MWRSRESRLLALSQSLNLLPELHLSAFTRLLINLAAFFVSRYLCYGETVGSLLLASYIGMIH
jgi:hypothetical protein